MQQSEFRYRIIYEQLSRLSGSISRATTLGEVRQCLQRHVKYLFDYQLIRFCFYQQAQFVVFSLSPTEAVLECGDEHLLCDFERLLQGSGLPIAIDDADLLTRSIKCLSVPPTAESTQLWGWDMTLAPETGVLASIFSTTTRRFRTADVSVLKIALENLHAKVLSIRLFDDLRASQKATQAALVALQEKNTMISELVSTQEEVIKRRTRELEVKNKQLLYLSRQHAHTLREPLSRIMSLTYLAETMSVNEVINDVIPMLSSTSNDLDAAIQHVVQQIDAELLATNR